MMKERRWFVTVDWCNKDRRGIFCNRAGQASSRETEYNREEMEDMLGPFWLILAPTSIQLTADELAEYKYWRPLAEYCGEFGIASKVEDVPIRVAEQLAEEV